MKLENSRKDKVKLEKLNKTENGTGKNIEKRI